MKISKHKDSPEVFYSIQGEGKNLGQPSIFIRLSFCNLYCFWCDTDYTWNWIGTKYQHLYDSDPNYKKYKKQDSILNIGIASLVKEVEKYNCKNVILTGGEPMIQHKELTKLVIALREISPDYHFEVETNGTIIPNHKLANLINQYNVSIKLSNSRVKYSERIVEKAVEFFVSSLKANFKFVIDSEADLKEVLILKNSFSIDPKAIYLMPQGTDMTALKKKQKWLVELCKTHSFNYTDRLHIFIYGDKRGG